MPYTTRNKLESMYGSLNVQKWADLNNDRNAADINTRISETILDAEDYINARLILGRYNAPFADPAPRIIQFMTTLYVGIALYDGRVVSGRKANDEVQRQRETFDKYMMQLLAGQLILTSATSGEPLETTAKTFPFNADFSDDCDGICDSACDDEIVGSFLSSLIFL